MVASFRKNQYLETRGSVLGVCALSDVTEREMNVDGEWEGSCTLKEEKEAIMPPHCKTSTGSPWLGKCPSSWGVLNAAVIVCPYKTLFHISFFLIYLKSRVTERKRKKKIFCLLVQSPNAGNRPKPGSSHSIRASHVGGTNRST